MPSLLVIALFIWPLPLPVSIKWFAAIALLGASQYHFWSRLSSGSMFSPEFPRWLIIGFNWVIGTTLILALLLLTLDLPIVLVILIDRSVAVPNAVRIGLGAFAGIVAAFGVYQAARVPRLRDIEITLCGLPAQFDGYRLLQLTDLHISRLFPSRWAQAVVQRSNALGVDLIVITGDLIDGSLAARRMDIEPLRALRAPDGVYVIPGNHEYFFSYPEWMRHFAALGMQVLENDHQVLRRDGGEILLVGVTDSSAAARGFAARDLDAALHGAPPGLPVILLDHQPKHARRAAAQNVKLQLSGHTHGGMMRGLDRLVARGNNGFVSGRYDVDGMILYVNNGTGLWPGFALRLGRPSELTRITLRAAV